MNPRRERFCYEYVASGNATKAAIEAGYSSRTARSIGQRLLTNVDIKNRIQEISDELKSEKIADIMDIQVFWSEIMLDSEQKTSDRLKASELLFRAKGGNVPVTQEEEQVDDYAVVIVPDDGNNGWPE